jgi:hypothetical protein
MLLKCLEIAEQFTFRCCVDLVGYINKAFAIQTLKTEGCQAERCVGHSGVTPLLCPFSCIYYDDLLRRWYKGTSLRRDLGLASTSNAA